MLLKLPVTLLCLLFVAACASNPPTSPPAANVDQNVVQAADNAALPLDANGQPLVATINGQGIGQTVFDRTLARAQQEIQAANPDALRAAVLDALIEQTLIEQAANTENIVISEALVDEEFAANQALASDAATWQQWLADNLYTEAEFRESLRATLITGAVRDRVIGDVSASVPQVHARHILVDSEQGAVMILGRLQNGEEFAALAAELSLDVTTREQGGDLGWFVEGELLESALTQVAFSLDNGAIAGPVATRLGYHVIQTLEKAERPVEEEKQPLLAQIRFENWLRELKQNADIQLYLS
jgi:parvulin-like peptidyl-prolyl isomerase